MTSGRSFERLVSFTDAVAAVAITLLVLSIVDIRGTSREATVWSIMRDHASELITFGFTFFVVAVMWQVHNRVFNRLRGYDTTVFWLNLLWMFGIVLLPWPSSLYGEGIGASPSAWSGGEGLGGAGMLYWGTLAFVSLMPTLIALHVQSHPELVDPESTEAERRPVRGAVFVVAFLAFGIASLFAPMASAWLPMLLIPISMLLGRSERRGMRATASPTQ